MVLQVSEEFEEHYISGWERHGYREVPNALELKERPHLIQELGIADDQIGRRIDEAREDETDEATKDVWFAKGRQSNVGAEVYCEMEMCNQKNKLAIVHDD